MAEYIELEAFLRALENADPDVYEDYGDGTVDWGFGRKNIQDMITGIPAADVAPVVHGQWVPCFDENNNWRRGFAKCSNCGREYYASVICQYEYCCRCGAKMDGGADHEAD